MNSSVGDLLAHPVAGPIVQQAMGGMLGGAGGDAAGASMMPNDEAMQKMMASFPIGRLAGFPGLPVSFEQIEQLISAANAEAPTAG